MSTERTPPTEKRNYDKREGFPRFYRANRTLQAKVGIGEIDPEVIKQAQNTMDTYAPDVHNLIRLNVDKVFELISAAETSPTGPEEFLPDVSQHVMQIKAIGGMFKFPVIGQMAGMLLQFLDTHQRLDKDMRDIIRAHNQSVTVLLTQGNDTIGQVLLTELTAAFDRYEAKIAAAKK